MRRVIVGLALLVCSLAAAKGLAHDDEYELELVRIRGMTGVYVLVEDLNKDAKALGFTETGLKTEAELTLRRNGVRVFTQEESEKVAGCPCMHIRISVFASAASIEVEVRERATLIRNPKVSVTATLWRAAFLQNVSSSKLVPGNTVVEKIEGFCNLYQKANPKDE